VNDVGVGETVATVFTEITTALLPPWTEITTALVTRGTIYEMNERRAIPQVAAYQKQREAKRATVERSVRISDALILVLIEVLVWVV
jgi:hypothetical protein